MQKTMDEEIQKKLETVREALADYDAGKLADLSALVAISMTVCPMNISDDVIKWAEESLKKLE